jgi:hypothetical protein
VSKIAVGMNGRIVSRQGRARGSAGERMNMKTLVLGLVLGLRIGLVEMVCVSAMANRTRPAGIGETVVMTRPAGIGGTVVMTCPAGLGGTVVMTRYSRCSFSSRSMCKFSVEFT